MAAPLFGQRGGGSNRWYCPVARQILRQATGNDAAGSLVETLDLAENRRLVVGVLAYRRRALPISGHVDQKDGTSAEKKEAFFRT